MKQNQTVKFYTHLSKKNKTFNVKKKKTNNFSGKLNSSKGYDLFGEAVIKILNKISKMASSSSWEMNLEKNLISNIKI